MCALSPLPCGNITGWPMFAVLHCCSRGRRDQLFLRTHFSRTSYARVWPASFFSRRDRWVYFGQTAHYSNLCYSLSGGDPLWWLDSGIHSWRCIRRGKCFDPVHCTSRKNIRAVMTFHGMRRALWSASSAN